jgi:hypothetical protein
MREAAHTWQSVQVNYNFETVSGSPIDGLVEILNLSLYVGLPRSNIEGPEANWQAHVV